MKKSILTLLTVLLSSLLYSQGVVLSQNPAATPDTDALFHVDATNGGLMIPKLTAVQRQALTASAAQGLWVYQTDEHPGLYVFNDTTWVRMSSRNAISAKVNVEPVSEVIQAPLSGTGYSVTQNAGDLGEFDVTFTPGTFNTTPTVMVSGTSYPPITVIDPYAYCPLQIITHCGCGTSVCQDYLDDCIAQSYPGGVLNPSFGFSDMDGACEGAPDGFVDKFDTYTLTVDAGAGSYYRLTMQSSPDWNNDLHAFIDWNQDADFFDDSEHVWYSLDPSPNDQTVSSGNLYPPTGAFNGTSVLRAVSTWAQPSDFTPCGTMTFGEVHNYKVIVQNGTNPVAGDKKPRAAICNVTNVSTSGFKVFCTDQGNIRAGTSFHFYATDN